MFAFLSTCFYAHFRFLHLIQVINQLMVVDEKINSHFIISGNKVKMCTLFGLEARLLPVKRLKLRTLTSSVTSYF